jgi:DNA-binding transcriptional MerR regulator
MEIGLPSIPAKRYFTIGEVSVLCGVKPYVLRYWEQEFTQLKPVKRRGNRRYYQHHEVLLIRRIRELLYDQGFTISGARNRLAEGGPAGRAARTNGEPMVADADEADAPADEASSNAVESVVEASPNEPLPLPDVNEADLAQLRIELLSIRKLLDD